MQRWQLLLSSSAGFDNFGEAGKLTAVYISCLVDAESYPRSFEKFSSSVIASEGTNRVSLTGWNAHAALEC
jgi:hypothetical protein